MRKHVFVLTIAIAGLISFVTIAQAQINTIRVAVLRDIDHLTIALSGRHAIYDARSNKKIATGLRLLPTLVSLENKKIKIGNTSYSEPRIRIEPRPDAALRINDKHFRGDLLIINNEGSSLTVINAIELEQYIRGVLYHEISDKWPLEAIKAQAVATRTYAIYSADMNVNKDYDVTNDVYSQVYGGKTAERYRTDLAVSQTKGEVLTYQKKIFPAFFCANSGGLTEDAAELWDIDLPPLKGGVESPFSVDSPHYRWKKNFRLQDIQNKLNTRGYDLGLIKEIKVIERNKSGRVRNLQITDRAGKKVLVQGKVFREILGPNVLRSNKYDVQMQGYFADFIGHGWGHGVGMDQWGAYNMSKLRYTYKNILEFYYPGSKIAGKDR